MGAAPLLALVSHGLWVDRYGSDPSIIGRDIVLQGSPFEVIGVMPDGYDFPTPETDVWLPRLIEAERQVLGIRGGAGPTSQGLVSHSTSVIARLAPGVTMEAAVADAERLIARFNGAA